VNEPSLLAFWDAAQGLYFIRNLDLWSVDGDRWHNGYSGQLSKPAGAITFVGGLRNGEKVGAA
jgi:hypothetical protein